MKMFEVRLMNEDRKTSSISHHQSHISFFTMTVHDTIECYRHWQNQKEPTLK